MAAPPVLILVHGTGAGEPNPADRRWWESEGRTAQDLAKATPNGPAELAPFRWTGRNSEKDRRAAGRALLDELRKYEDPTDGRDYRLIGHSHGGSVIWHALAESARGAPLSRLKGWITVGTPFLQFRPAWTYLWIVLAAAAAVFAAWNATTLLIDAWPDRDLVMRHARTYPVLGYVIDALLAVTLPLGALLVLTPAGALVVRGFPSLKNVPGRIQFAIGIGLVLAALGGGAWFVVWSDLIHDNAAKAGLWATAALLCLLWVIAASFIAATLLLISRGLEQRRRDRREREAVARYGPLWQPFTHAFDETVAGLAASRVSPYPVAAPHPGPDASVLRQLFSIAMAPLARVADDFIWWMLMRRLQGADIWGLLLVQASAAPSPLALTFGFSSLADPAAQSLLEDAAKGLGELGSELRAKLVKAGEVPDAVSAAEIVGSAIKWTEVVHTLYFRDIRMMGLLEEALVAKPRTPLPEPAPPPAFYRAYSFLPLTVASCLASFAIVWGLGLGFRSLHAAYIKPNLAATQVDIAAGASQVISNLAIDKNPILGEYLVRVLALGRLPNPAPTVTIIHDQETRAAAVQRLAFAYGFAGRTDAPQLLDGLPPKSFFRRPLQETATIHALAGFVAAKKNPDAELVQQAVEVLRKSRATMGLRELYCTAIPALFAAGRSAEANEFFKKFDTLKGVGCDEAIDREESRQSETPLPCIVQERIAFATAQLGKFDDALAIATTCKNKDRMRLVLLRLSAAIEDGGAAARFLEAAAHSGKAPAAETIQHAAALARLGKLDEAAAIAKPVLEDPKDLFDAGDERPFRPLFNALTGRERSGPLLDSIISAQQAACNTTEELAAAIGQRLELVRMLVETNRSSALADAAAPIVAITAPADRKELTRSPAALLDAAEIVVLAGQPGAAEPFLKDALNYLRTTPSGRGRARRVDRAIALAHGVSPAQLALGISTLQAAIEAEPDAEERAKLTSIVSNAYLKSGDPVMAVKYAREAGLPHRVLEAYCRILDRAIAKPQAGGAPDYGLKYANWPAPSSILSPRRAFHDAFGPQTCDAPGPIVIPKPTVQ
jgi:tetratricopeptide (TPR) repeat protein